MALLLMTSTMGFTVSKHYCGTRLVDVSINKKAQSCCGNEGTSKCCHNETHHFQVEDDFNLVMDAQINVPFVYMAPVLFLFTDIIEEETEDFVEIVASPPPPDLGIRLSFLQSYLN
ncbi:hypothetical protein KEM10_19300 [Carboxylicivirga linearis]|uniref:Uncharacterized protein n=2 Tax=Carboxylicivirga linearis TaxID=1628157 RepID=A0ABS5K168_9BACT|nr:hypothetical protein [Carboxylicivirga linearis]